MIVVLCFVITGVATALIYWRWVNVTEPTSYIIVEGVEEHNGTLVTVCPEGSTDPLATATLDPTNQYAVTIFLHPGAYTLTATQNGETLVQGGMLVAHRRWKTIVLRRRKSPGDASPQASRLP